VRWLARFVAEVRKIELRESRTVLALLLMNRRAAAASAVAAGSKL
jgi:hypothetical protein